MILRKTVRMASRLALVSAAIAATLPQAPVVCARLLPSLSPFLVLGAALAARTIGLGVLLCLPVLAFSLVRKRLFCRYLCPTGFLLDAAGKVHPAARGRFSRYPFLGRWLAFVALGGALFGFPVVLWLDPLSLFNSAVRAFHPPFALLSWLPAVGLGVLGLLSIWRPGLWCYRCCPLGALQDWLHVLRTAVLPSSSDSGGHVSPERSNSPSIVTAEESDVAAPPKPHARRPLSPAVAMVPGRRAFLAVVAGGATAVAVRRFGRPGGDVIRPPGAVPGIRFNATCVRCGNCIRACPTRILRMDVGESGVTGLLTPVVRFGSGYCRETCNACGMACPTGAIASLSLDRKREAVMGIAEVLKTDCVSWADQEYCMACADACPYDAFKVVERNHVECPVVDETACVGCGACEFVCPARTLAIKVTAAGRLNPKTS